MIVIPEITMVISKITVVIPEIATIIPQLTMIVPEIAIVIPQIPAINPYVAAVLPDIATITSPISQILTIAHHRSVILNHLTAIIANVLIPVKILGLGGAGDHKTGSDQYGKFRFHDHFSFYIFQQFALLYIRSRYVISV